MLKIKIRVLHRKKKLPVPGDVIVCTLPEAIKDAFHVEKVLENGVIVGYHMDKNLMFFTQPWAYGDNYNILIPSSQMGEYS